MAADDVIAEKPAGDGKTARDKLIAVADALSRSSAAMPPQLLRRNCASATTAVAAR
jgi:hypothetical protein